MSGSLEGKHLRIPQHIVEQIRADISDDYMFYYNETNPLFDDDFYFSGKPDKKQWHGYCTKCNTWSALDMKPNHRDKVTCPNCYHEVELRAGGRGRKRIKERKFVRAFELKKNGKLYLYEIYVDREDFTDYEWNHEAQYESVGVGRLHVITENSWEAYDCGYYDDTASKMKTPRITSDSKAFGACYCFGYYSTREVCYLEPDFALEESPIKHIAECIGDNMSDYSWWHDLETHLRYPFLEKLYKANYFRLWRNVCTGQRSRYLNLKANNWKKLIRCGNKTIKPKLQKIIKINRNISIDSLENAAYLMEKREDFLPEYADRLSYNEYWIYMELKNYGSRKIYNYLCAHEPTIWQDYLRMAEDTGTDLSVKSNAFPKDLDAEHDRLSERINSARYGRFENGVAARYAKFCDSGIEMYRHGGLIIHAPVHALDIVLEGQHMNNCVASYTQEHALGETTIFFIRRENSPNESYFTLELSIPEKKGEAVEIEQCYGYRNKEYYKNNLRVEQFLRKFINHINYCKAHKKLAKKYHGKDVTLWTRLQKQKTAV